MTNILIFFRILSKDCESYSRYLSDKYSEEQPCEVPGEEQEGGAEPQVIEEVQQSSQTVNGVDGAAGGSNRNIWY